MTPTPGIVNSKSPNYVRMSYSMGGERPKAKELPLVIGVIAELSGMPEHPPVPLEERPFLAIDISNFDDVMRKIEPHLALRVSNALSDDGTMLGVDLRFRNLADFAPANVVRQVPPLAKLLELRSRLHHLLRTAESDKDFGKAVDAAFTDPDRFERLKQEVAEPQSSQGVPIAPPPQDDGSWSMQGRPHAAAHSVLDEIVESGRSITTPEAHVQTREAVHALVQEYAAEGRPAAKITAGDIRQRLCLLDELISNQLRIIMHSPAFQKLEASWRGLRHLVRMTRKTPSVKVRVLNASKTELREDFRRKDEFKKSALARRILVEEFETLGGEPYGLVIADYEFGPEPQELELLEEFARVAASACVPFVAAPHPSVVGVQHFGELPIAPNWSDLKNRHEFARWCAFQGRPRSRYVGLVLPRILVRSPYGRSGRREQEFEFEEGCDFEDRNSYLWGSAAWAVAARLANDFERYGWFGGPRDSGDTGAVKGLPAHSSWNGSEAVTVGPVEACVDEERATALAWAGLIALRQTKGSLEAQLSGTWSCHVPVAPEDGDAEASDDDPLEIETLMSACRVAHYIRSITKVHRDTFRSRASCEQWIQRWIADYIVPAYMADSPQAERFPLRGADVSIVDSERADGRCLVRLVLRLQGQTAPVELEIPIYLPRADPAAASAEPTAVPAVIAGPGEIPSGRDQFLHRLFLAEQYLRTGRIEPATAILEGLDEQVERFHLLEWESPKLIGTIWAMLRECYRVGPATEDTIRRSAELLRRYCAVNPTGLLE